MHICTEHTSNKCWDPVLVFLMIVISLHCSVC